MTTYLWGVATPFLITLAALLVIHTPGILRHLARTPAVKQTLDALALLHPSRQRQVLEFWRGPGRYTSGGRQLPAAYARRDDVYGSERTLTTGDTSGLTRYGPLLPRLLKWGLYPVLAAGIFEIAQWTREIERQQQQAEREQKKAREAQQRAREAAETAARQAIAKLLGPNHTDATFISYPNGALAPDLDTVVYLPEAPDYEPDPDRPGVLVKSPALAVHVKTDTWPTVRAYKTGAGQYHGLNLDHRLRAHHPDLYTDQAEPNP